MSDVALEASSLVNPLADAWRRTFERVGLSTQGVLIGAGEQEAGQSSRWTAAADVDGPPGCVVSWWGLAAARQSVLARRFPSARHVVIVDTYPNASRLLTEGREWLSALSRSLRAVDAVVCYSDEMADLLRRRRIISRRTETHVMVQPFELASHRDAREPTAPKSMIFTGRSDLLFGTGRSMAKDALGGVLSDYLHAGFAVTIADPGEPSTRDELRERGFALYPRMTNDEVLAGGLADIIVQHSFQLCLYQEANGTIRRRMATGLSSRFALGLTANTPLVVPPHAASSRRFVESRGIGAAPSGPGDLTASRDAVETMRDSWRAAHRTWSAEGQAEALHRVVGR